RARRRRHPRLRHRARRRLPRAEQEPGAHPRQPALERGAVPFHRRARGRPGGGDRRRRHPAVREPLVRGALRSRALRAGARLARARAPRRSRQGGALPRLPARVDEAGPRRAAHGDGRPRRAALRVPGQPGRRDGRRAAHDRARLPRGGRRRKRMSANILLRTLALAALIAAAGAAQAQSAFPSRPVKIVVPSSAGGATDTFARALAPRLSESWGQPVVIENRPGANQIIGSESVSKAAPDGTTLLVSEASSFVMNPHLYKKLPYDALGGFTPITALVRFPWVLVVHPSLPVHSFAELVAYARANPGKLSYGSFGLGSSGHISMDYLKRLLGLDIVHVPYKGGGP